MPRRRSAEPRPCRIDRGLEARRLEQVEQAGEAQIRDGHADACLGEETVQRRDGERRAAWIRGRWLEEHDVQRGPSSRIGTSGAGFAACDDDAKVQAVPHRTPQVEIDEHAVLRIAAWPIDTLTCFSAPRLAARAVSRGAADADVDTDTEFEAAIPVGARPPARPAGCADHRAPLLRALVLANRQLAARWLKAEGRMSRARARDRRLEATVFRYLCRAAGRPTPNGTWAGAALVRPEPDGASPGWRTMAAVGRVAVSPNLVPFATAAHWLAQTDRYVREGPVRLDPTGAARR